MASTTPKSTCAGSYPVSEKLDEKLSQLVLSSCGLVRSRVTYALGQYSCDECKAAWYAHENPHHIKGCRVGRTAAILQQLIDAQLESERSSAAAAQTAHAAVEERPRDDFGEPWGYGVIDSPAVVHPVIFNRIHRMVPSLANINERIVACVNYCAGVSSEVLATLTPLRELGIGHVGAGVDAILGKKGGAK